MWYYERQEGCGRFPGDVILNKVLMNEKESVGLKEKKKPKTFLGEGRRAKKEGVLGMYNQFER